MVAFWLAMTIVAGLVGLVSVRLFLPAFLVALMNVLPLTQTGLLASLSGTLPAFWCDWPGVIVLGLLASLEYAVMDDPDSEGLMAPVLDRGLKPLLNTLLVAAAIGSTEAWPLIVLSLAAWPLTLWLCRLRQKLLRPLIRLDPDDSFGLQSLRNGIETIGVVMVMGVLWLCPPLLYPMVLLLLLFVRGARRLWRFLGGRHRHACPRCGVAGVHDAALRCPVCLADQPAPRQLNIFGGVSGRPVAEVISHRLRLLRGNRCPHCASRRENKQPVCAVCRLPLWRDGVTPELYLRQADHLGMVYSLLSFALLMIPYSGVLAGIFLHRVEVLRPLRLHISPHGSVLVRFLVQTLAALLFVPALIPGLGWIFVLPLLLSHRLLRRRFCQEYPEAGAQGNKRPAMDNRT